MCHDFIADASFWQRLLELDQLMADEVHEKGCPYCEDVLHAAPYPRKPRGDALTVLGGHYQSKPAANSRSHPTQ